MYIYRYIDIYVFTSFTQKNPKYAWCLPHYTELCCPRWTSFELLLQAHPTSMLAFLLAYFITVKRWTKTISRLARSINH